MSLRIVLVGTSHPGNIGSVARAMKTMGLEDLYLVAPERFPAAEATAMASNAADVLGRARICSRMREAVDDCGLVVGTTARPRQMAWRVLEGRVDVFWAGDDGHGRRVPLRSFGPDEVLAASSGAVAGGAIIALAIPGTRVEPAPVDERGRVDGLARAAATA